MTKQSRPEHRVRDLPYLCIALTVIGTTVLFPIHEANAGCS